MTKPETNWERMSNPPGRVGNCKQKCSLTQVKKKIFYEKVIFDQQELKEVKEGAVKIFRGRSLHNRHIMTTFILVVLRENTLSTGKMILLIVILLTVIAVVCHAMYS